MKLPGTLACFPRLLAVDLGRVECQLLLHWLHNTALPQDQDRRGEEEHAVVGDSRLRPTKELSQVRADSAGTCGGSSSRMVWTTLAWFQPKPSTCSVPLAPALLPSGLRVSVLGVGRAHIYLEGKKQTCIQASGLLLQQLEPYSHLPGGW